MKDEIRKKIAELLAAGTGSVIVASALIGAPHVEAANAGGAPESLRDRVENVRKFVAQTETASPAKSPQTLQQWRDWYNQPRWSNWSDWHNRPRHRWGKWSNWYNQPRWR